METIHNTRRLVLFVHMDYSFFVCLGHVLRFCPADVAVLSLRLLPCIFVYCVFVDAFLSVYRCRCGYRCADVLFPSFLPFWFISSVCLLIRSCRCRCGFGCRRRCRCRPSPSWFVFILCVLLRDGGGRRRDREHAMEGYMTAPMLNPLYHPPGQGLGGGGGGANGRASAQRSVDVLRPCCELQGLEIWQGVYMRDNLLLHHR